MACLYIQAVLEPNTARMENQDGINTEIMRLNATRVQNNNTGNSFSNLVRIIPHHKQTYQTHSLFVGFSIFKWCHTRLSSEYPIKIRVIIV